MRNTMLVAGQELWFNLRRPGFLIMTLLVPLLGGIALLLASLFGGQVSDFVESQFVPKTQMTGYVDYSGLLSSDRPGFSGRYIAYRGEASAREALVAEEIDSYFVLETDYLETGSVKVYGIGGGFSTFVAADEGDLDRFLVANLLAGRVDRRIEARVMAPMDLEPVTLDEEGQVSSDTRFSVFGDFVLPYLFSLAFVIIIFTTSGFLLQGVSEEKEGRVIEILLSSISPTELLAGKILGLGALGLIQVAVWISAGAGLLSATAAVFSLAGIGNLGPGTVILGIIYFVLGYLLFATLMAVAGSMGTTQRESQQIASIFSVAAAIPWMVISVVFTNPQSPLVVALSYIPLTSPVMMLLRLGLGPIPAGQTAVSLGLLVVGLVASLWAGAKVFRVGLLMYGKRPNLRDVGRAFRQA